MGIKDWCDPNLGLHERADGTQFEEYELDLDEIEEYVEPQLVVAAELVARQF